jgi:DNA-directed RNA polymerase subunit K/omega
MEYVMKRKVDSRGPNIDMERCVDAAGGRYALVIMASQRLRELKRQHRNNVDRYITPVDVLQEIQDGSLDVASHLAKIK